MEAPNLLRLQQTTFGIRSARRATAVLVLLAGLLLPSSTPAGVQDEKKKPTEAPEIKQKDTGKVPSAKELEKNKKKQEQAKAAQPGQPAMAPVEAVVELTILAYGGRKALEASRASITEQGTIRLATDQGDVTGSFHLRSIRKEKSWLDLLRTDLELNTPEAARKQGAPASVKYVIAFNGATVWSAQNDQYANARPEAEAAFRALLSHEYTTLLRYKEDGSKIELKEAETRTGISTNVIEMTTPDGQKTKYWISTKTFRILHAEYELKLGADIPPTKYMVSYYYTPLRVVQNTLVPVRKVMTQDGKFVQEVTLTNIGYSAKLDPEIFQHLQAS
jgi:hypothetical protein